MGSLSSTGSLMAKKLLAFFLALVPLWASATYVFNNGAMGVRQVAGGVEFIDGAGGAVFQGRTFTAPSSAAGQIAIAETYGARIGGGSVLLGVARTLGPAVGIANAVALSGAALTAGCTVGGAIATYAGWRDSSSPRLGCDKSGWFTDKGQDPESSNSDQGDGLFVLVYKNTGEVFSGKDPLTVCRAWATAYGGSDYGAQAWISVDSNGGVYCGGRLHGFSMGTVKKSCPASIDALDPAYNVPAGSAPGPDGKCPTGRYASVDATTAANILSQYGKPANAVDAVKEVLNKVGSISGASERQVSGPASVTGTPINTTQQNADGSTSTSTKTPTINYIYNGNKVTYNTSTSTVTNTCTGSGSCTSSTTTTDETTQTKCEINPMSAGCGGDVADIGTIYTKKDKTFSDVLDSFKTSFAATPIGSAASGFLAVSGSGGCPTYAWTIPYLNTSVVIDEFCSDFATKAYAVMKVAVLVGFAWLAYTIMVL